MSPVAGEAARGEWAAVAGSAFTIIGARVCVPIGDIRHDEMSRDPVMDLGDMKSGAGSVRRYGALGIVEKLRRANGLAT